jgi:hypothetical protein
VGGPNTIPLNIREVKLSSNSLTHEATQFGDSICPVCISTFKCLFIRTQPMRVLSDTGGGYHLEALNIRSDQSPSLSSIILHFPLISPLVSNYANHSTILLNHIEPPSIRKGPITSGFQPLIFYRWPTQLIITYYHYISFIGVNNAV